MGGGAVAAAAAQIAALKASGVIVRVEPDAFVSIMKRQDEPLVVVAEGGVFRKHYQYLMSYKGLAFLAKSPEPLQLPRGSEIVIAKSIWVP